MVRHSNSSDKSPPVHARLPAAIPSGCVWKPSGHSYAPWWPFSPSPAPVGSWQENPTPWDGASVLGCPRVSLVVCSGAVVSAVSPAYTWARQLPPPVQAVKAQPPLPWGEAEMVMTRSGLSSHHLLVGATCSLHPCVHVASEHRTRAWAPTSLCRADTSMSALPSGPHLCMSYAMPSSFY